MRPISDSTNSIAPSCRLWAGLPNPFALDRLRGDLVKCAAAAGAAAASSCSVDVAGCIHQGRSSRAHSGPRAEFVQLRIRPRAAAGWLGQLENRWAVPAVPRNSVKVLRRRIHGQAQGAVSVRLQRKSVERSKGPGRTADRWRQLKHRAATKVRGAGGRAAEITVGVNKERALRVITRPTA